MILISITSEIQYTPRTMRKRELNLNPHTLEYYVCFYMIYIILEAQKERENCHFRVLSISQVVRAFPQVETYCRRDSKSARRETPNDAFVKSTDEYTLICFIIARNRGRRASSYRSPLRFLRVTSTPRASVPGADSGSKLWLQLTATSNSPAVDSRRVASYLEIQ